MRRSSALLLACLSTSLVLVAAAPPPFTFPRSAPEAQGISSAAILAFVEEAERKLDALHSVMIVRHGKVVAEGWWAPYARRRTAHDVLAEQELHVDGGRPGGRRRQAHGRRPGARLLPRRGAGAAERQPQGDARSRPADDDDRTSRRRRPRLLRHRRTTTSCKAFLAAPVAHKPGNLLRLQHAGAAYMLSAIVQKVTGQTVLDYLGPRLFEPLGIENPTWDASKQGVSTSAASG